MHDIYEIRQEAVTKITERNGVFFAFSKKQLLENKVDGVKYFNLGAGTFVPQDNLKQFEDDLDNLNREIIKISLKKYSPIEIIKYELANHEYCITYDSTDTREALAEYNFSDDLYKKAIKEYINELED